MEDLSTYSDETLMGLYHRGQAAVISSWSQCPQKCGGGGRGGRVCHVCAEKELIRRHGQNWYSNMPLAGKTLITQ